MNGMLGRDLITGENYESNVTRFFDIIFSLVLLIIDCTTAGLVSVISLPLKILSKVSKQMQKFKQSVEIYQKSLGMFFTVLNKVASRVGQFQFAIHVKENIEYFFSFIYAVNDVGNNILNIFYNVIQLENRGKYERL